MAAQKLNTLEVPGMKELAELYKRALRANNPQGVQVSQQAAVAAAAASAKAEEARRLAIFADMV